eukprot:TRINITY_DN4322_c0_g3_i1.p1 TRINITY_DN4322_c0_g3~~TRINITY_DN4322_c0_g3_i1.p1  ORF type:complete len:346 (+),score=87.01 TRINITY_DN4322_c0_g3_i1:160-1197(+)
MATEKGKEASLDLDLHKRMRREGDDRSSDLDSDLDSDLSIEEALEKQKKKKPSDGGGDGESTKMKVEVESGPCEEEGSESRAESEERFSSESSEKASTARQDEISSGLIDRSLPRANTLPRDKADFDKLEPSSSQLHLERSKTDRRIQNNIAGEAAQIFDDKISARKKLKMLNRIATVRHDGTVEFNLPSTVEPESLRFGSRDTYNEAVDEEPLDSTDLKYIPPLQIVILIVGTRGDVQPFIAIGKRLQDYGHRVRLSTHSNFKDFVLTAGLEFFPIGGDPKILAEYMVKNKGFLPSGPSEIPTQRKQMKEIIYSLLSACKDPDTETGIPFKAEAIIANPPAYGD